MNTGKSKNLTRTGKPWSEEELRAALEGYLLLLNLQQLNIEYSNKDFYQAMLDGPLRSRNEASLRYRLRNISFVFQEMGFPVLKGFSPASQVGKNVKALIISLTAEYRDTIFLKSLSSVEAGGSQDSAEEARTQLIGTLDEVNNCLNELLFEFGTCGHNNPPDDCNPVHQLKELLQKTRTSVESIRTHVTADQQKMEQLKEEKNRILSLTTEMLQWGGIRFTKFLDAALITLAPVLVAKLTNLFPLMLRLANDIQRFLNVTPS